MSEGLVGFEAAVSQFEAAVTALQAADPTPLTDDQVVELLRRLESTKRRLATVEHALTNAAAERSLASSRKCRSTVALLSELLRIDHTEAAARVKAAEALAPRVLPSGGVLGPRFPAVAAALASGVISARHAQVITRAVDALPDAVVEEFADTVEATLLEWSRQCEPSWVDKQARKLVAALDQDGTLREERERERRRDLQVKVRPDGSSTLTGELTAHATEALLTALDALTRPTEATDTAAGQRIADPRTAGQRRHDALLALCLAAMRARLLPNAGGVACSVLLTMDADAWITGTGTARTGHGYTVSAQTAKTWAGGSETGGFGADARFLLTLLDKTRAVCAYSCIQRIFTEQQRLALIARDGGCSMPGCNAPPAYCEVDHVTEWRYTGRTSIDNAALLCSHGHRHRKNQGWTCQMINGRPAWLAPPWLDPTQQYRVHERHLIVPTPR